MHLQIINTGSSGNGYIISSDTEALVIEAGAKPMDLKKALDFNISKVVGVCVSHSHL